MAILLNNTRDPDFQKTPEIFDILLRFSMINNFGANYSMRNLDDENYIDLQYLQICLNAQADYQKRQGEKNTFYSKENV